MITFDSVLKKLLVTKGYTPPSILKEGKLFSITRDKQYDETSDVTQKIDIKFPFKKIVIEPEEGVLVCLESEKYDFYDNMFKVTVITTTDILINILCFDFIFIKPDCHCYEGSIGDVSKKSIKTTIIAKKKVFSDEMFDLGNYDPVDEERIETIEKKIQLAGCEIRNFVFNLNEDKTFILESSPDIYEDKFKSKKGMFLKSFQRPNYTVLTPKEIRHKMNISDVCKETGKKLKFGHERRAYTMHFTHERYVNMRGKSRFIPAVWVGPDYARVERHHYKVLLNK